jgi:rubrerythrin
MDIKEMIEFIDSQIEHNKMIADASYSHEHWNSYHDAKGSIDAYERMRYFICGEGREWNCLCGHKFYNDDKTETVCPSCGIDIEVIP